MEQTIDITMPLDKQIPIWPGSEGMQVSSAMAIAAGDAANVSILRCDVHTGTHIDAPRHFISSGKSVDEFSLQTFLGPAYVAHLPARGQISARDLEQAAIPPEVTRLLLRTDNSCRLQSSVFSEDYTYLTPDAASWIAARNIVLFGFDYLSIEQYGASPTAHLTLLTADIVILEGLNLIEIDAGWYELICLPLRLIGSEGAPVRAVLKPLRSHV